MRKSNMLQRIVHFYIDGFRNMTIGRTLWTVILIKLFIIFVVLKLLFFPNFLKKHAKDCDNAGFVSSEMIDRAEKSLQEN